jgi:hypothetical protein
LSVDTLVEFPFGAAWCNACRQDFDSAKAL